MLDLRLAATPVFVFVFGVLGCGGGPLSADAGGSTAGSAGGSESEGSESSGSASESGGGESGGSESGGSESTETETETETGEDPGSCGDGVLDEGEGCDDGNLEDGDGCSASCELEALPGPIECGGWVLECGDTLDNDMDGFVDLDDPECTSPCDDVEGGLCYGLPVFNFNCGLDCAWDFNAGSGDDQCHTDLRCDPESPGAPISCEWDPDYPGCDEVQSDVCVSGCGALVPNGCDCFGCCEVEGQTVYLAWDDWGSCCTFDDLDSCSSCTIDPTCFNPCDAQGCELCFGQTLDELAPGCDAPACPPEKSSCTSEVDCEQGWFCQTGCCTQISPSVGG